VIIYNMGRDSDGRRYYTMKALRGRTLAEVFQMRRRDVAQISKDYSTGRLLEILQRVAETIAFAHEKDVAHLDLSPSNIVLGEFGNRTCAYRRAEIR
jgi:eukaryotic-like serine/threonine-protein kinase